MGFLLIYFDPRFHNLRAPGSHPLQALLDCDSTDTTDTGDICMIHSDFKFGAAECDYTGCQRWWCILRNNAEIIHTGTYLAHKSL